MEQRCTARLRRAFRGRRDKLRFKRELRPTDIFIVGHPKSGNTWLTLMMAAVLEDRFGKRVNVSNVKEFAPAVHADDLGIGRYAHFGDPRLFRNEGPVYPKLYPKTVYIVRDPRAVYVSYYHHYVHDFHMQQRSGEPWSVQRFIDELIAYGCVREMEPHLIRWDKQVLAWMKRSRTQPVKIVKYEDMQKDRQHVLEDVLTFAEIPYEEEKIQSAVERGSFQEMRRQEEKFGAEPYSGTKGEGGFYMRKGKVDGWREELTPDLAGRIENEFREMMRTLGYV
jgi:hypothetical protein